MAKGGDLARAEVRAMRGYEEEASPGGLNLMNNANLFGPNPAVARALAHVRPDTFWNYPSLDSNPLRQAAARAFGVRENMIVTGNGSNELIDVSMRTFCEPGDRVAYHWPSFSMIPVFARTNGAKPAPVPLRGETFQLDADALVEARGKITVVCRPNNPTGNAFPRRDVERVLDRASGIVIVDEAYIDFYEGSSFLPDLARYPNLIVLRTLSKSHGLAGLRIGFAIANEDVAQALAKVRGPFRLNTFSEIVGSIALADRAYVDRVSAELRSEKPRLAKLLEELGFRVFPSDTNFLLVKPPVDARKLAQQLAARGVFVRDFEGDLAPYLRITVGPPSITARLLATLRDVVREMSTGGASS